MAHKTHTNPAIARNYKVGSMARTDRRISVNRPSGSDLAEMAPAVGWVGAPAAWGTEALR